MSFKIESDFTYDSLEFSKYFASDSIYQTISFKNNGKSFAILFNYIEPPKRFAKAEIYLISFHEKIQYFYFFQDSFVSNISDELFPSKYFLAFHFSPAIRSL